MHYHLSIRILHWLMAITIICLLALGIYMSDLPREDESRATLYFLHKSFGVMILLLVLLRMALRVKFGAPALPATIKPHEQKMAHAAHHLLYLLMFSVPLAGVWLSNSYGYGASFFDLFELKLFPENKDLGHTMGEVHEILAFTLLGLVVLHVLGALKHRFIDKHDVIYRMTGGQPPKDPSTE